jgi:TetR/AcrR family transcriptional repressor of nem operon
MGRKSDAHQRILEAGTALFQQRAYASIGVAEICAAAGVPKGSFYHFFPSKQALALEVQTTALKGTGAVTGCLFGNLALEVSAQDDPVRERLQQIFEEQIDLIEAALQEGTAAGEFTVVDPRWTAKSIVAQIEGMVLFAKLFNDPGQLDALWQNSLSLLGLQPAPAA